MNFVRLRHTFRYAVVEEVIDERVAGTVAEWPGVDDRGRLWFDSHKDSGHWIDDLDAFQEVLDEQRGSLGALMPEPLAERPVSVGDVYAMGRSNGRWRPELDVTWDAAQAGKAAFVMSNGDRLRTPEEVSIVALDTQLLALAEHRPPSELDIIVAEATNEVDQRRLGPRTTGTTSQ